jgi:hypothetical protein
MNMEDLIASIPVLIATLFIIIAIFWFTNRNKKQREQKIIQLSLEHGWMYEPIKEPLAWGYRLKGKEWTLESVSRSVGQSSDSGSSNISQTTQWHCGTAISPDRKVIIGERLSPGSISGSGAMLMQQALQIAFGSEAAGLSEVKVGHSALQERYLFLSRNEEDVKTLLTPNLVQLLANWQGKKPVIKLARDGIQVEIQGKRVENPEEILSVVHLGDVLLDAHSS